MKVAVASKDGIAINEHFGHARAFRIYELTAGCCVFRETREVAHYCQGNTADASAMPAILAALADCEAVFVARIGDGPVEKLRRIGVTAVAEHAYLAIEDSLLAWLQTR